MVWINSAWKWIEANDVILWWLFAGSLALLLLSPIAVGWIAIQLPKDYFTSDNRGLKTGWVKHPLVRPVLLVVKNLLGVILLLAGVAMLFVPGQGLLTIVVGLMLINFPGKRRLQCWLVTRPKIWKSINWLRERAGREPFECPN